MIKKGMKICHVNTRSLYRKINQLSILFDDFDLLCCTETWLDNRFSDSMVNLPGKTIFRCDRRNNVNYYDSRPTAGGVCIYIDNKFANFTEVVLSFTKVTVDFEVLTLITTHPNHRHFISICVYKPPKGDILKCIEFLKNILADSKCKNKEIWILGDFNTDLLKRDDPKSVTLLSFAKKAGLSQLIKDITRPNRNGGSCIDLIMTNCM